ncbi:uncharacterized protein LOC143918855 [Arctopsyche grandis]|uniref:uncharacterized protein LOC143918855 n=1 Tax=Arctopsyche grandis TaxID=121162 RepID=UPI00406D6951
MPLLLLLLLLFAFHSAVSQDYDVTDIQCSFGGGVNGGGSRDSIIALLRKPEGFKGSPLFADDRSVAAETDTSCQIRPDPAESTGLLYRLRITDFSRCGVLKRNGFVHVRVWFPQFPGVVMQSDQELIIMCKPPEPTVIENKAAGFAGSFPHGARVSGVVEETPGRLEYEVALYKEAPAARVTNSTGELPVDQAVPIGTKLQLRARINPDSAWKYVKLMEVTVSPDPDDPRMSGSVILVKEGCRNRDFASIIPHQPARYRDKHNEVFLDFEAFLLSTMKERSTLWIHSQIKACMDVADCQPDFCLDLFESSGHGRRKRQMSFALYENTTNVQLSSGGIRAEALTQKFNDTTQFTKFKENIEYTVVMPGELFHKSAVLEASCNTTLVLAGALGCLLLLSGVIMCYLANRLHTVALHSNVSNKSIEQIVRQVQTNTYCDSIGYTGRPTVQ